MKKRIAAALLCACLTLTAVSCGPVPRGGTLDVMARAARAELDGTCCGEPFSAVLTLGPAGEDGRLRGRDMELLYTGGTPEGIRVICRGDVWEMSSEGAVLTRSAPAAAAFALPGELFRPDGDVVSVRAAENGSEAQVLLSDGGRSTWLLDAAGVPLEVRFDGADGRTAVIRVVSFRTEEMEMETKTEAPSDGSARRLLP